MFMCEDEDGVPQHILRMTNSKINRTFSVGLCAPITLGLEGVTSRNFFT